MQKKQWFYLLVLISVLFIGASSCSKKTAAQKNNKEYRKNLRSSPKAQRRVLRWEHRLKLDSNERAAVDAVKNGTPYSNKDYKIYSKYYKKKKKIERKIARYSWKHTRKIQDGETSKRLKKNKKKASENNRYKRNSKMSN